MNLLDAVIPDELNGAVKVKDAMLKDVPTKEALAAFLLNYGVDSKDWGQGTTKDVGKYWKELRLDEAGLEVWKKESGEMQPVRIVHVLRAKVTSPSAYQRGIFLFNTLQQYGDGRKRTRNGLLSEKLSMSEMPFEENMHKVCVRAVTEEEMQRVVESSVWIGPHSPAMTYDAGYVCPLNVVEEHFVSHTIEVEISNSYPGLLTMYHLYTVDIVCSGLPSIDFNTLEFEQAGEDGIRKLKYIHAWVWLEWAQIQRHLFEGSELKDRKMRGSFTDVDSFRSWLAQFALDLDVWGTGQWRAVQDLFDELENEDCSLELWDRYDGVPLLMRVVHTLQIEVTSSDPRLFGKHLWHMWTQQPNGQVISKHRLLSRKLDSVAGKASNKDQNFDSERFVSAAKQCIADEFAYFTQRFETQNVTCKSGLEQLDVRVLRLGALDQRFDVEESPSFKGLHTMYHMYTMEAVCENLPVADFASIDFTRAKPHVRGWRWMSWYEAMDFLNTAKQGARRLDYKRRRAVEKSNEQITSLADILKELATKLPKDDAAAKCALSELEKFNTKVSELQASFKKKDDAGVFLPPSMISKMSRETINSGKFGEEAEEQRLRRSLNCDTSPLWSSERTREELDVVSDSTQSSKAADGQIDRVNSLTSSLISRDSTLVSTTLLRGVPVRFTVRNFGKLWASPAGSSLTHDMSKATSGIKHFLSHSWRTRGWLKTIAVLYIFNLNAALVLSGLTHLVVCILVHLLDAFPTSGLPPYHIPAGTSKIVSTSELYYVPACIVFLVIFVFGAELRRGRYEGLCFLDKCCINQTDATKKQATIRQLGGFLRNSDRILVLWNEEYFTRLWCVYEVAAFCYVNKGAKHMIFAPMKVFACTLALHVFHSFACISLNVLGPLTLLSNWHVSWVSETIPEVFQPFYFWVGSFLIWFAIYFVPSFGLWLFSKLHMEDRRLLLQQLRTFKVSDAQCYLEDDRQFVEEQITLWFGSNHEFEHYVQTVIYKMVVNLLEAQGPLPYRMVLVGSLPHLYFLSAWCLTLWRTDPIYMLCRFLPMSFLMLFCNDAIAISLILRLADASTLPTIWERVTWTQKVRGPIATTSIFAAVVATSCIIILPTLHLGIALAIFILTVSCTWILYGGTSFVTALSTNHPTLTGAAVPVSKQQQLDNVEQYTACLEKERLPQTLGAEDIDGSKERPGPNNPLTVSKTMDFYV